MSQELPDEPRPARSRKKWLGLAVAGVLVVGIGAAVVSTAGGKHADDIAIAADGSFSAGTLSFSYAHTNAFNPATTSCTAAQVLSATSNACSSLHHASMQDLYDDAATALLARANTLTGQFSPAPSNAWEYRMDSVIDFINQLSGPTTTDASGHTAYSDPSVQSAATYLALAYRDLQSQLFARMASDINAINANPCGFIPPAQASLGATTQPPAYQPYSCNGPAPMLGQLNSVFNFPVSADASSQQVSDDLNDVSWATFSIIERIYESSTSSLFASADAALQTDGNGPCDATGGGFPVTDDGCYLGGSDKLADTLFDNETGSDGAPPYQRFLFSVGRAIGIIPLDENFDVSNGLNSDDLNSLSQRISSATPPALSVNTDSNTKAGLALLLTLGESDVQTLPAAQIVSGSSTIGCDGKPQTVATIYLGGNATQSLHITNASLPGGSIDVTSTDNELQIQDSCAAGSVTGGHKVDVAVTDAAKQSFDIPFYERQSLQSGAAVAFPTLAQSAAGISISAILAPNGDPAPIPCDGQDHPYATIVGATPNAEVVVSSSESQLLFYTMTDSLGAATLLDSCTNAALAGIATNSSLPVSYSIDVVEPGRPVADTVQTDWYYGDSPTPTATPSELIIAVQVETQGDTASPSPLPSVTLAPSALPTIGLTSPTPSPNASRASSPSASPSPSKKKKH